MKLLEVKDLEIGFAFAKPTKEIKEFTVVKGVSFDVAEGECVALVGESGAGKTLTARSIIRLLPKGASITKGNILYKNQNIVNCSDLQLNALRGKEIGMVFQDPLAGLNPLQYVGDQIAESLEIHANLSKREREKRVLELLDLVQIDRAKERIGVYPHQLSGGQRQRVMLAIALANNPKLIIADEPTTALDASVQHNILNLLKSLQKELKTGLLLITHDLGMVQHFADTVHVMKDGYIVESSKELFENPQHAYSKKLLYQEAQDYAKIPETAGHTVFEVKNLSVEYPRMRKKLFRTPPPFLTLNGVNFALQKGECLGIVGESGSGKSSLALAILRLIKSKGSILLNNLAIDNFSHKQMAPYRKILQVIFQDPYVSLNPRMTIRDIIEEGLQVHDMENQAQFEEKVIAVLHDVGLHEVYLNRFPHELSGGERQRVAIARALVLKPEILILDEPTSSLDRSLQFQIIDLLKALQERYAMSFIYISHDLSLVKSFCQRLLVLKDGDCVEYGQTKEIFEHSKLEYVQLLLKSANTLNLSVNVQ